MLDALIPLLADPDAEVRLTAAWAIGSLEPATAPPALYLRTLQDPEGEVRVAATNVDRTSGPEAPRKCLR